jgi:hypothetical protein
MESANDDARPQRRQRLAARFRRGAVDDQDAVEVVDLVLHAPRTTAFQVERHLLAALVSSLDPHRGRALHRNEHALKGQAALVLGDDLVALPGKARIDDRGGAVAVATVEDEDAAKDADLGGRETDADRIHHQCLHSLDEPQEIVVELLDGIRDHPQRRIGILPDLGERELPPRVSLGVEFRVDDYLPFDLAHSGHTSGVERRERESIMRQGVTRAETPRDRAEREALEVDLVESPLAGRPLERRLREIELRIVQHEERLAAALAAVHAEHDGDDEAFRNAWEALAISWSFGDVNELIERHNRNFPAEARLPMNPRTGDFVPVNGRPYRRKPLDARWILERFPARDGA